MSRSSGGCRTSWSRTGCEVVALIFLQKARSHIDLLRAHIAKEDECLAEVVHRTFSSDERESLTQEFEEMERREIGDHAFARFAAIIEALEAEYG